MEGIGQGSTVESAHRNATHYHQKWISNYWARAGFLDHHTWHLARSTNLASDFLSSCEIVETIRADPKYG